MSVLLGVGCTARVQWDCDAPHMHFQTLYTTDALIVKGSSASSFDLARPQAALMLDEGCHLP
jgi:hypothetical protein